MKKALSLILALVLCLVFCACRGNNSKYDELIGYIEANAYDDALAELNKLFDYEQSPLDTENTEESIEETKPVYTLELTFKPSADLQSYIVTGLDGIPSNTDIVIPDTYEGMPVTAIGADAFYEVTGITSITVPNGVTTIGSGAFEGCANLSNIVLPESISKIGIRAFVRCGFTSVSLPDGITILDDYLFAGCTNLSSITIPDSVTTINHDAFYGITNLTIYGKSGSYAETYAKENYITFVAQ